MRDQFKCSSKLPGCAESPGGLCSWSGPSPGMGGTRVILLHVYIVYTEHNITYVYI